MSFEPGDYLRHILVEVEYLLDQSHDLSFERFATDETLRRAFVRSLEVIGEAVKNLPEEFRAAHSEVEWRPIARMRDRLIHGYFGVDYQLVWDVVQEKLPELKRNLQRITLIYNRPPIGLRTTRRPAPLTQNVSPLRPTIRKTWEPPFATY
jgi:uncharacterized protein with HEPN domain